MAALPFSGGWKHSGVYSPCEDDFLWIDAVRQRMIEFVVFSVLPVHRVPIFSWFRHGSGTEFKVALGSPTDWETQDIDLQGDRLLRRRSDGLELVYRRISAPEYPDWLDTHVAAVNSMMDRIERQSESGPRD